jgi:hypothetical protein
LPRKLFRLRLGLLRKTTRKDALLEILKKIQGSMADVRNAQVDTPRDMRDIKSSDVRILGMIGELVKAKSSFEDRLAH